MICRRARLAKEVASRGFSCACRSIQKSLDNIRGTLNAKDLVRNAAGQLGGKPLADLLHEPLFVPRTTPVKRLFLTFKQKKVHMAIVVSEYGKVLGLVTMDDLLAQIFGVMRDERAALQAGPRGGRGGRTPVPPAGPQIDTGPVVLVPAELGLDTGPDAAPTPELRAGARRAVTAREHAGDGYRARRSAAGARGAAPRRRRADAAGDRCRRARARASRRRTRQRRRVVIATSTLVMLIAACTLMQAFFVAAEVALSACDRNRLRARAAAGNVAAARAERMLAVPQVTLATTLVGANLMTLVAVLLLAVQLAMRDISPLWSPVIVVPPLLVLGHLAPKAIVQAHAERLVGMVATPLAWVSWLLRPIVVVVGGYATALTKALRTDRKKAFVTRDELALLIESEPQSDKPEISADEREMIANVFELSEVRVGELMVPLSEVTALPEDTSIAEAAIEIADKQHSRMPIYRARVDDIVGIVHVFDVLQAATAGKAEASKTLAELAHPPSYVPEGMVASDLLVQLQSEGQHLAIVVDEYGGAVGIVTIEDLLEIIVGDIEDEYDHEPSPIRAEKPGVWRVEARTTVERLNSELEVGLPESDDYETVAGLLIERFRRIPDRGETTMIAGTTIEVVAANDRAIEAVRITKKRK